QSLNQGRFYTAGQAGASELSARCDGDLIVEWRGPLDAAQMVSTPITFESVRALSAALVVLAFAVVVTWYRRPALPVVSKVLGAVGLLLLAVAAGEPRWHRPSGNEVLVMVDLSPSTRGAGYRDPAALRARVASLLGR